MDAYTYAESILYSKVLYSIKYCKERFIAEYLVNLSLPSNIPSTPQGRHGGNLVILISADIIVMGGLRINISESVEHKAENNGGVLGYAAGCGRSPEFRPNSIHHVTATRRC